MKDIAGRTALLTGASGGIGAKIAEALADAGVKVVLTGRRKDALENTAAAVAARGGESAVVPADLGDFDALDGLVTQAEAAFGPIDILVNNAGVELASSFTELTRDEITSMIDVNLTSPLLLAQRVLPGMLDRGAGHVVFVSSGTGRYGPAYESAYGATKAGLITLTQSLRGEYRASPVGFSVICPGFVAGDGMYQRVIEETGQRAPRILGETTTTKIAASVVRAIRKDIPEVLQTGSPVRPLIAMSVLAPRTTERVVDALGMSETFRRAAEHRGKLG